MEYMEITQQSAATICSKLKTGVCSVQTAVDAYRVAIKKLSRMQAYTTLADDDAVESQIRISEQMIKAGKARALEGLPLAAKDLFCSNGLRTTAGSKMLENFVPNYSATVLQRLMDHGAILLGKTNMDEFAMGTTSRTSYYGIPVNPWRATSGPFVGQELMAGGSSGGSATAVAGYMCAAAFGSDTGGSVRYPAALCGVVGMRPTYGRCSRYGMIAFSSSLDQAGLITRDVYDSAMLLELCAGLDLHDSTSADIAVLPGSLRNEYNTMLAKTLPLQGITIGVPYRYFDLDMECSNVWKQGIKWLEEQGAKIVSIELSDTDVSLAAYYGIVCSEAVSNLAKFDGIKYGARVDNPSLEELYCATRQEGFGREVQRRILIGGYILSSQYGKGEYYYKAKMIQQKLKMEFAKSFETVQAILMPTNPSGAIPLNQNYENPVDFYRADIFAIPPNLAELPSISVPCGYNAYGLPVGLQIVTKKWDESLMFGVAGVLEKCAKFIPVHMNNIRDQ